MEKNKKKEKRIKKNSDIKNIAKKKIQNCFVSQKNRFVELNLFFHFITEFRDPIFKNVHLPSNKNKNNFIFKRLEDYIYIYLKLIPITRNFSLFICIF